MNRLPNLIIGGCHKSGTTSLFNYLKDHPEVSFGIKKEIHYFTPLRYGGEVPDPAIYEDFFRNSSKETKYLIDASPSYLYGEARLVSNMFELLESPRVIFIFRNPTERFVSFVKKRILEGTLSHDLDLLKFVKDSYRMSFLKDVDAPKNRAFREGCYARHLKYWIDKTDNISILYFENLVRNPRDLLIQISKEIKIDSEFYNSYRFDVSNKYHSVNNLKIHKLAISINKLLENVLIRNRRMKSALNSFYFFLNTRKEVIKIRNYSEAIELLNNLYENEITLFKEVSQNFSNIGPLPDWMKKHI